MSEAGDFIKAAAALGFVVDGYDGRGHRKFRHRATGEIVRVSATPGDRWWANQAIRDMQRAAGRRVKP
jgi:hypothetical protein